MQTAYTAVATSLGDGRSGSASTSDGVLEVKLAVPPELGGPGGAVNPEQLFALGYSACFHSAMKGAGRRLGVPIEDSAVTAEVSLGRRDDDDPLGLSRIVLRAELGGVSEADARRVVELAHELCPYSRVTRGNVEVVVEVEVG